MEILYEDNHLLVVNKPAGALTQPTAHEQESLETEAKQWIKKQYKKSGHVFLHSIHRLDRPVSGVVVFARTSKALSRLNQSMREKKCKKIYYAWVEKMPENEEGQLKHKLVHDHHCARIDPEGKEALLYYRVLEKKDLGVLVEIELVTGRYHQIRAQMAAIGSPIVGDFRYGAKTPYSGGIALHHFHFSCPHPIGGKNVQFEALAPFFP